MQMLLHINYESYPIATAAYTLYRINYTLTMKTLLRNFILVSKETKMKYNYIRTIDIIYKSIYILSH
ncbi:hypothetical protein DDE73_21320 [Bacillus thuringiensis]|nr:hypothetical protein DDE73_21320 [Bacillus thuringiensis]TFZ13854.1 hypothetical protein C6Y54_05590 [Bacillus cereus]